MLNYEKPLEAPWISFDRSIFIEKKIKQICRDIHKNGEDTEYLGIFDMLYIHIDDNIYDFLPEVDHD